jgi:hypothetical protein
VVDEHGVALEEQVLGDYHRPVGDGQDRRAHRRGVVGPGVELRGWLAVEVKTLFMPKDLPAGSGLAGAPRGSVNFAGPSLRFQALLSSARSHESRLRSSREGLACGMSGRSIG